MASQNMCGNLVRKARSAKGWTEEQLAQTLSQRGRKTTAESISRLEAGERQVLDDELLDLAWVLQIPIQELLPSEPS